MKKNYLKIIFVIDESGSMGGTESDVIGGFNSFIKEQKSKPYGKIDVTLYKFNDACSIIFNDLPLDKIRPLSKVDYTPGGLTALYDTIGIAISEADKQNNHLKQEHKPDMVMMVIITDGQENASHEYTSQTVKRLIQEHEQNEDWQFIYLGADFTNFADADSLGIKYRTSSRKKSMKKSFSVISDYAGLFRSADLEGNMNFMMNDLIEDLKDDEEE